jgi:hypothetical protein
VLERIWEKGTLIHCWWECKLVQTLWKTVWRLLKKQNIDLSLLGSKVDHPSEEQKDTQDNVSHKARFISSQLGLGICPMQWVSTRTPNTKFRLLLYFFRH